MTTATEVTEVTVANVQVETLRLPSSQLSASVEATVVMDDHGRRRGGDASTATVAAFVSVGGCRSAVVTEVTNVTDMAVLVAIV